jgi:hypothetical protein
VQGTYEPLLGDFNGDGRNDVFWYGPGAGYDVIWYGRATGGFATRAVTVRGTYQPLVADFNGDGLMEAFLVIGQGTSTDEFKKNYGRVMAIKLKGKGPTWTTFRSNLRRTGNPAHNAGAK